MQKVIAVLIVIIMTMGGMASEIVEKEAKPMPSPSSESVNESTYNTQECHAMLEDFFERTGGYEKYKQQAIKEDLNDIYFDFVDINYDQVPEIWVRKVGKNKYGEFITKVDVYDFVSGKLVITLVGPKEIYNITAANGTRKTLVIASTPVLINFQAFIEIYSDETQGIKPNLKFVEHQLLADCERAIFENYYDNIYMYGTSYTHVYDGRNIDFDWLSNEVLLHGSYYHNPMIDDSASYQVPVKKLYDYLYSHNVQSLTKQTVARAEKSSDYRPEWIEDCSFPKNAVVDSPVQNETEITQSTKVALEKLLNTDVLDEVKATDIKIGLEDITKDGKPEVFLTYTANDENGYPMPYTNVYSLKDNRLLFSTFGLQKILKNDQTGDTLFWMQYYDNKNCFTLSRYNSSKNSFKSVIATISYPSPRNSWQNEQNLDLNIDGALPIYKQCIFEDSIQSLISLNEHKRGDIYGGNADVVIYEGYNPTPLDFAGYGVVVQNADGTYSVAKNAG